MGVYEGIMSGLEDALAYERGEHNGCSANIVSDEVPRRKKKSQAKPPKKAKHKHYYEPCALEYPLEWYLKEHERKHGLKTEMGAYCSVCGKVGRADMDRWYVPKQDARHGYIFGVWHDPSEECVRELDPATRTLPTFWIDDPFTKYVDISNV